MKEENKKSAMETANTTTQYKNNSNTLYHKDEKKETGKMILIKDGLICNSEDQVQILEYPEGTISEQMKKLRETIGEECDLLERVWPVRLYELIGVYTECCKSNGREVNGRASMLVDEEYLFHPTAEVNSLACLLYETDKHRHMIKGNVLIIGEVEGKDGIEFCGITESEAENLYNILQSLRTAMLWADKIKEIAKDE